MLRPQVFALQDGEVQIGLICSEKQAIDATLESLAKEDPRFCPVGDKYWNARGGSHTDGGAFVFTIQPENGGMRLSCPDKFGNVKVFPKPERLRSHRGHYLLAGAGDHADTGLCSTQGRALDLFAYLAGNIPVWDYNAFRWACDELVQGRRRQG